jgi:hypothetical protein
VKESGTEGLRRTERGWTGVAARDPRSHDLPDFRTLGDGPYPPILLEAFERAGNGFRRWSEQVEHAGYCCRPIRIRGRVEQVDRATGEVRGVHSTEGEPDDVLLVACRRRAAGAVPVRAGTGGTPSTSWRRDFGAARGFPIR